MQELAIILGITGLASVIYALANVPHNLRVPLVVFNGFYFLTSVIGALLVTNPEFQLIWKIAAAGADVGWLSPGDSPRYWILLLGPLIVVNIVALVSVPAFRPVATALSRNLDMRISQPAVALVGMALVAYCILNLAQHDYLGASLLSSQNVGFYRENIQLRTAMAQSLGEVHFGIVYMALPSVCVATMVCALQTRRASWWLLFSLLSIAAVFLYLTTLTKSNLIIFVIALGVTAYTLGAIRVRGIMLFGGVTLVLLTAQEALLTGSDWLEIVAAVSNLVLRLSSAVPFYVQVFPEQEPFVGIDYGLMWFGIGPEVPPNLVVFNYMFPDIRWVQGAAPAAAHISAYAQAGLWFSLLTMVLVGALIGFFGSLGRVVHAPLAHAAFVGGVIMCYYTTQTDLVGAFNHSYGYKWWLLGLLAIAVTERLLRWLLNPPQQPAVAKPEGVCESESQ